MARIPGGFVPLDMNYVRDRAIRQAGTNAELLYIRALAYSRSSYSDGIVPDFDLPVVAIGLRNVAKAVAALVREGLWEPVDGGWRIRSWAKWNGSEDRTEAEEARSSAAQATNHRRWHVERGVTKPDCPLCQSESVSDIGADNEATSLPSSVASPKNRIEENRTQTDAIGSDTDRSDSDRLTDQRRSPSAFEAFYDAYPRKVGKKAAHKAFTAAVKNTPPEQVIAGARRLANDPNLPEPQYVPHPATWIRRGGWDDDPYPPRTNHQLTLDQPRPGASGWDQVTLR